MRSGRMKQGLRSTKPHLELKFPIYSFDIYIHHVLNFAPLPLNTLVFGFRLWEFPLVTVGPQSVDFTNQNVKFYCGKSCVFSMEEESVLKKMAVSPLYLYLFSTKSEKGVELIGTSSVHLSEICLPTMNSPNPFVPESAEEIMKKTKIDWKNGRLVGKKGGRKSKKERSNVLSLTQPFRSIKGYDVGLYDIDVRIRIVSQPSDSRNIEQSAGQFFGMKTQSTFRDPGNSFSGTLGSTIGGDTMGSGEGNTSKLQNLVQSYHHQQQESQQIRKTLASTFVNLEQRLQDLKSMLDPNNPNPQRTLNSFETMMMNNTGPSLGRQSSRMSTTSGGTSFISQPKTSHSMMNQTRPSLRIDASSARQKEQILEQLRARSQVLQNEIVRNSAMKRKVVVSPPSPEWYEKKDHTFHDDLLKNTIEVHLEKNGVWEKVMRDNKNNRGKNAPGRNVTSHPIRKVFTDTSIRRRRGRRRMKRKTKTKKISEREKWKYTADKPYRIERRKRQAEEKEKKLLRQRRMRKRKRDAMEFLERRKIVPPPPEEFRVIQKQDEEASRPQKYVERIAATTDLSAQPSRIRRREEKNEVMEESSIYGDDDGMDNNTISMDETFEEKEEVEDKTKYEVHQVEDNNENENRFSESPTTEFEEKVEKLEEKIDGQDTLASTMGDGVDDDDDDEGFDIDAEIDHGDENQEKSKEEEKEEEVSQIEPQDDDGDYQLGDDDDEFDIKEDEINNFDIGEDEFDINISDDEGEERF